MGMASTDGDALYWGGHEYLALVLGYAKYDPAAKRQVSRAVAYLIDAELITRADDAKPGRGRVYLLSTGL